MISRNYPLIERRLKPIYDSLDNCNPKKALQEAEKLLKKQPDLQCAKVLKCLALSRMGKEVECIQLLCSVKAEEPIDESTLQLMSVCYRDLQKPKMICELYESASKKMPGNEEILNNLFTAYVRIADYKKQQLTANYLYKINNKNQYYFWAIISLLLQSAEARDLVEYFIIPINNPNICAKDRPYEYNYLINVDSASYSTNTNIIFAECMLKKFVSEDKIKSEQELLVYIAVLQIVCKYEEALEILDQPVASLLDQTTIINFRLYFLAKLKRWDTMNHLAKTVIQDGHDSWNLYLYFIDSAYELKDEGTPNSEYLNAKEFLDRISTNYIGSKKRASYLARLELCSRFSNYDNALKYLVEYFKQFGSKESCVYDLRPYIRLLDPKRCVEFLELIWEPMESAMTKAQINYHICNHEFGRIMGIREVCDLNDRRRYVLSIMRCYVHSLDYEIDVLSTETRSGDRYALLAIHTLYDLWIDTKKSDYLFEAIVLCQYGLSNSPSNSHFKILLVKFYHLLGGVIGANTAYLSLDIKHMQLDTLGYLHVLPLLSLGAYQEAKNIMTITVKFFTNNLKESADHINFAYKYESYSKIPEFIHIREKINNSAFCHQINVERMLMAIFNSEEHNTWQIVKGLDMSPEIDSIIWSELQDNRDFTVIWDVEPEPRSLDTREIIISYNHDLVLLRLRSLLLRIIASAFSIPSDYNKINIFIELLKEFESVIEQLKLNGPASFKRTSIRSPPKSRLLLMLDIKFFELILNLSKLLLHVVSKDSNDTKQYLEDVEKDWKALVSSMPFDMNDVDVRCNLLQMLSIYIELVSFSCIIISVAQAVLKQLYQAKKSKKKNKEVEKINIQEWRTTLLHNFINYLTKDTNSVSSLIKTEGKLIQTVEKYGDVTLTIDLDPKEKGKIEFMNDFVNRTLIQSHVLSISEITLVLKTKIKYLTSIKLQQ